MVCGGETLPSRIGGLLVFDTEVRGGAVPRQRGIMLAVIGDIEVVGLLTGWCHLELQTTGVVLNVT